MTEYYTKGIILDRMPRKELDDAVIIYTKELGKIIAHSKSTRKIESKLSGHLDIGKFVKLRVIKGNNYKIVDALSENIGSSRELLKFIGFIKEMTPYETPDPHLWHGIEYVIVSGLMSGGVFEGKIYPPKFFEEKISRVYKRFLEIFGYGAEFAKCSHCESKPGNIICRVAYFSPHMITFLCSASSKLLKIDEEELVKI